MKCIILFFAVLILCGYVTAGFSEEYLLVENGTPKCNVLINPGSSPAIKYAAKEFSSILARVSGGKAPEIMEKDGPLYPVCFVVNNDAACADEGYILSIGKKGIRITAKKDLGILYGVYNLLKDVTGIRWVYPGADGEYFRKQPTVKVVSGTKTVNPSFSYRSLSFHAAATQSKITDTWDWMIRNGLRINAFYGVYTYHDLAGEYDKRGAELLQQPGFSCLLGRGAWNKNMYQNIDKLWETHKEYFPVINGKRTKLERQAYQPCTTNPDVIRLSTDAVLEVFIDPMKGRGHTRLYNNDGTGWCQCDRCRAIDTPRDRKTGYVSNRYWTFLNAIAKQVFKNRPGIKLDGLAYQNFQAPPEIKIDPRLGVQLSFNRVCYRHNIDDPKCLLNPKFCEYYTGWAEKGIPVIGREELGPQGDHFQPAEETYVHLLKYYKKMGFAGTEIAIAPPDGWFRPVRKDYRIQWRSMWQSMYFHALYLWNINADFNKNDEEVNSLYYGRGWAGGMRDFRKLLRKAASETPGCFGHGFSAPLGRCLDQPGVHEKLRQYLSAAEKAAALDPDPRALAHVKFDRMRFRDCWEKSREIYLKNYRELRSYQKTAPIEVDGVLDEPDWKNADIVTCFKSFSDPSKIAKVQTYARIVYEPEYLYVGLEMMEPEPKHMLTSIQMRDGAVWNDNDIELFLSHPDMGNSYFHFIFNAAGIVFDQKVTPGEKTDKAFNSSLLAKTRILNDRWVLELKIPTAELGEKCFPGQSWKVNMMRARLLKNHTKEISTLSGGAPHDTGTFMSVAFSMKRGISASRNESDSRLWKNGSFNELGKIHSFYKNLNIKENKVPSGWVLAGGKNSMFAMEPIASGSKNYYLSVSYGKIMNDLLARSKRYRVNFRFRGEGNALFYIFRYDRKNCNLPSKIIYTLKGGQKEWKYEKFEFENPAETANERLVFAVVVNGKYDFDEIYLAPIAEHFQ